MNKFFYELNCAVLELERQFHESNGRKTTQAKAEALDLILDSIRDGLTNCEYKRCSCGNWHQEEGEQCDDCIQYCATVKAHLDAETPQI